MRLGGTAKPGPRSQDSFEGQLNKKSEQELGRGLLNDSSSLEITVCGEWEPGPLRAVRVQPVWLGSRVCTCEEGRGGQTGTMRLGKCHRHRDAFVLHTAVKGQDFLKARKLHGKFQEGHAWSTLVS